MDTPDFGGQLSALVFNHGSALRRLGPARFAVKQFVLDLRGAGVMARPAAEARRHAPRGRTAGQRRLSPALGDDAADGCPLR